MGKKSCQTIVSGEPGWREGWADFSYYLDGGIG